MKVTFSEDFYAEVSEKFDYQLEKEESDFVEEMIWYINAEIVSIAKRNATAIAEKFWDKIQEFKEKVAELEDEYNVVIPPIDDDYYEEFEARSWLDTFGSEMTDIFTFFYDGEKYDDATEQIMCDVRAAFDIRFDSEGEEKFDFYISGDDSWTEDWLYHMQDERHFEKIFRKNDEKFGKNYYSETFGCEHEMREIAEGKISAYDFFDIYDLVEEKEKKEELKTEDNN